MKPIDLKQKVEGLRPGDSGAGRSSILDQGTLASEGEIDRADAAKKIKDEEEIEESYRAFVEGQVSFFNKDPLNNKIDI
jgi:hypothetical protein